MKNKTVKMVLAVIVLVVCCVAYVGVKTYVANQEQKESDQEEAEKTEVFSASADDITSLNFVIEKNETTFEKDDDKWIKKDETGFPVNQTTINDAVSAITTIDTDRVLTDVKDLSEYGLDNPSNTIQIVTSDKDGDQTTTLRIGDENISTQQYYVSKDDDKNTVYLVDASCVEPFGKKLYDYAQQEDFPVISDTNNISKVSVEGNDIQSYELVKNSDTGFWNVCSGSDDEKADSSKVSALTSLFSSLSYETFVNYNCKDKGQYGLDKPYAVISADYKEEKENSSDNTDNEENNDSSEEKEPEMIDKQITITVGDLAEGADRYVIVNDSNEVYTISGDSLSDFLDKSEEDFWDLTVSYVSKNDLSSLDINYENNDYSFSVSRETSKDDDGNEKETFSYQLNGDNIDENDFTPFYNKLTNMAGQRRLTDEFSPDNKPEMTVVFNKEDGNSLTVEYYSYDSNYYAVRVDNEKVYLVNKMTVKEMFDTFSKLADVK